jgi:hypothetical protein
MDLHIDDLSNSPRDSEPAPIVILATQIMEDISELCAQWAILNRGEDARTIARRMDKAECHHEPAVRS